MPNRGSQPASLFRESYREAGKVKNRTLANLSRWPEDRVDALAAVLTGRAPPVSPEESFDVIRSVNNGPSSTARGKLPALILSHAPHGRILSSRSRPNQYVAFGIPFDRQ